MWKCAQSHSQLVALQVQMFAPDAEMMHVVNHCEGKPVTDTRNVLQESARIARGDVTDLVKLDVGAFDALIIPGDQTRAHCTKEDYREKYRMITSLKYKWMDGRSSSVYYKCVLQFWLLLLHYHLIIIITINVLDMNVKISWNYYLGYLFIYLPTS